MISFRTAIPPDSETIVELVNSAYRGESSKVGWTTEADLLEGTRTDLAHVLELFQLPFSQIELAFDRQMLIGCVHLKKENAETLYFGMLTVKPSAQTSGIGKALIDRLEAIARDWGCARVRITVIHLRSELISFYERRGYRASGGIEAFHVNEAVFGRAKVPEIKLLEFIKAL